MPLTILTSQIFQLIDVAHTFDQLEMVKTSVRNRCYLCSDASGPTVGLRRYIFCLYRVLARTRGESGRMRAIRLDVAWMLAAVFDAVPTAAV